MTIASDSRFDGADRLHAERAIALARSLSRDNYLLARYVDDESGTVFSSDHFEAFARNGFLPNGKLLMSDRLNAGWRIDARIYRHGPATPNTPWFYTHSFLHYEDPGPISAGDFAKIRDEWRQVRPSFGNALFDAGDAFLRIAQRIHADPERFEGAPYIDIRRVDEYSSNYLEFLAFADDYWLHVFLTDAKKADGLSIITFSFTPWSDDDMAIPPDVSENLLTWPMFSPE